MSLRVSSGIRQSGKYRPRARVPITIIEHDGVCSISTFRITGHRRGPMVVTAAMAAPLARPAFRLADDFQVT